MDIWKPHVVVAAIIERDGRFLMVEEETDEGIRINQPAGHLDPGESLIEASVREALEETAYHYRPSALVGVYLLQPQGTDRTYLRFAFTGSVMQHDADRKLDHGILRTMWLTREELMAEHSRHRSPLVMRCVDDYLAGRRYPLEMLAYHP